MNAKKFSEALGNVREEYITEAIAYQPKRHRRRWAAWGAAAACVCFLVAGMILYHSLTPADFHAEGSVETTRIMTTVPVGDRTACYEQMNIAGSKLKKYVGAEYRKTDPMVWYFPVERNTLNYLIREEADGTLTLWQFRSFEMGPGETYTYGDVLSMIYGVAGAEDIVSITTSPMNADNTELGQKIQKEIGTQTDTDREDIASFYNVVKDVICYGMCDSNPADDTRFTYSFSTEQRDKLATGESTYGTRCLSIALTDGTTLDSWIYSALSGSFFEYGGIFTEPLKESDVDTLNTIFGIE